MSDIPDLTKTSTAITTVVVVVLAAVTLTIAIPEYEHIKEWLGFDTVDSLREDKAKLTRDVSIAKEVNQHNEIAIIKQAEIHSAADTIVVEASKKEARVTQAINNIKKTRDANIQKKRIEQAHKVQPQQVDQTCPQADPDNIDALWAVYNTLTDTTKEGD